jgi:Site-specific recombinases, DNA invertase Pin homologs
MFRAACTPAFPRTISRHCHAESRHAGVCCPTGLGDCPADPRGGLRRGEARSTGKANGSLPAVERSTSCWYGAGPLGPVGNGSAGNLQELEHLGVGFVSLTEALDLTTPRSAMAGLLAVFAAFEREILGERTRAGLAHAGKTGNGWVGQQRQ